MPCPICGRVYCDHTPAERGQSHEEMMADCCGMTVEEYRHSTGQLPETPSKKEKDSKKK